MSDKPICYEEDDKVIYRASAAGMGLQALVAARLGYEAMPPSEDQQRRFDDGHVHEEAVIKNLEKEGWQITDQQREVNIRLFANVYIRGHIDGIRAHPELRPTKTGFDIKSMSTASYTKWLDKRFEVGGYVAGYAIQLGLYGRDLNLPMELIAKNKDNGKIDVYELQTGDFSFAKLKIKMAKVEAYAKQGNIDLPCDGGWFCPYRWMHEDEETKAEFVVNPTPEIESLIKRYLGEKEAVKAAEKVLESTRQKIEDTLPAIAEVKTPFATLSKSQSPGRKTLDKEAFNTKFPDIDLNQYQKVGHPYTTIRITPVKGSKS